MEQYLAELQVVRWHIDFLKDGRDAKKLLRDYEKLKVEVGGLKMQIIDIEANHEKKIKREKQKQKNLEKKISDLNANVI